MVRTATCEPVIYGTARTRVRGGVLLIEVRPLGLENRIAAPVRIECGGGVSRPDAVCVKLRGGPIEVHAKLAVASDGTRQVLRMVEEIEEVHLELHLDPLCQLKILAEGQVYVAVTRPRADAKALAALLADLEAVQGEHVGVEPLPRVAGVGAAALSRDAHWDFVAARASTRRIAHRGVTYNPGHRGSGGDADDGADFPRP